MYAQNKLFIFILQYTERLMKVFFFLKWISEIRADNPSLAVNILNDTPREREPPPSMIDSGHFLVFHLILLFINFN